jgi:hypothetical protein
MKSQLIGSSVLFFALACPRGAYSFAVGSALPAQPVVDGRLAGDESFYGAESSRFSQ